MTDTLYYVADPMCSWCWGFRPQLDEIRVGLPDGVVLAYVMGGLARDSDDPMPAETVEYVQQAWRDVEARTGAEFNWEFWQRCEPRRSTYPSCRAVLAAEHQAVGAAPRMFAAIQHAYYQQARNPSDEDVLVALAGELGGLDAGRFASDLRSPAIEDALQADFARRRELSVRTFPSLVLCRGAEKRVLLSGYGSAESVLGALGV